MSTEESVMEQEPVACWHKHRSERAAAECRRLQARPRCVQCGALIGNSPGAYYRKTGAWTCADCHYADFG